MELHGLTWADTTTNGHLNATLHGHRPCTPTDPAPRTVATHHGTAEVSQGDHCVLLAVTDHQGPAWAVLAPDAARALAAALNRAAGYAEEPQ